MSIMAKVMERAAGKGCSILLPESYDPRVVEAAEKIHKQNLAKIILLSDGENPIPNEKALLDAGVVILDYKHTPSFEEMAQGFYELRKAKGVTPEKAREAMKDPMAYACMMVRTGLADGLVSGAAHSTGDTLRPALQIVKTGDGIKTVSAYFLIDVPDCEYGNNGVFLFADSGLVEFPTPEQLADIAVASARSFEQITQEEPIVALLTYSTKGSAKNERLKPVLKALEIIREKYPNLKVDGELQLDAAIDRKVADMKAKGSIVAGNANVLVFPDLNAGNIGYKLAQRLGKAEAYGPMTQGLRRPVNDLSRGCSADDIVGVVALTCLQSDKEPDGNKTK
ncbi:MAG: phosphate acetyltransferase [Eubacterium sp.]|nr:phosphate acetyltransferase [Eubacterium sp.]